MKKSLMIVIGLILILSLSFTSAFSFSEIWKKITGEAILIETCKQGGGDVCSYYVSNAHKIFGSCGVGGCYKCNDGYEYKDEKCVVKIEGKYSETEKNAHIFKFYLHPELVPDIEFAKRVLPKYVEDMNYILAKNTNRYFSFDPNTGIILTSTKPQDDHLSGSQYPVGEDAEMWAHAVLSNRPDYLSSYGGYASFNTSGARVAAGLHWLQIYDPDMLEEGSNELKDYWIQIDHMLHEFAHVFGAGVGEYYNLAWVDDTTGIEPIQNIRLSLTDSYWIGKEDYLSDPLLGNAWNRNFLGNPISRDRLLEVVKYSSLTATVMSNDFSSLDDTLPDMGNVKLKVYDSDSLVIIPGVEVKIWTIKSGGDYNSRLVVDQMTDDAGELIFEWVGDLHYIFSSDDNLALIKVYKDDYVPYAKYVSGFDAQKAKMVEGKDEFSIDIYMQQKVLCSDYGNLNDCNEDRNCEWCLKCSRRKWNGLAQDSCVEQGLCQDYSCNVYEEGEAGNDCGALCDDSVSCANTECDNLDGCYNGAYRDYEDIVNYCKDDCSCTSSVCTYRTVITDNDGDGYDVECDNDCDDRPKGADDIFGNEDDGVNIHPGATELYNGIDDNCDGNVDYTCNKNQAIGDVNNDGNIDLNDKNIVIDIALGKIPMPSNICCADVNFDKDINKEDSLNIEEIFNNLESSPGCCDKSYVLNGNNCNKCADLNNDGKVDLKDFFVFAAAFDSEDGDKNWNPKADLNNDGKVDLKDFFVFAAQLGKECIKKVEIILKSDFLKNDETALSIAQGKITDYKFSDLYKGVNHPRNVNPDKFQYKIFSALRMLGYSLYATQNKPQLVRWAEAFQRKHNLPISDFITADFILRIDEELLNHENQIKPYLDIFPIDEDFKYKINDQYIDVTYIPNHENEPSKDHLRFSYSYLFNSLPNKIAPMTLDNVVWFFLGQGRLITTTNNKWKLNYRMMAAGTFFHEYGHQIDGFVYNGIYCYLNGC